MLRGLITSYNFVWSLNASIDNSWLYMMFVQNKEIGISSKLLSVESRQLLIVLQMFHSSGHPSPIRHLYHMVRDTVQCPALPCITVHYRCPIFASLACYQPLPGSGWVEERGGNQFWSRVSSSAPGSPGGRAQSRSVLSRVNIRQSGLRCVTFLL